MQSRVAQNQPRDNCRAQQHATIHQAVDRVLSGEFMPDSPDGQLARAQANWAEVQQEIEGLPPQYRQAIMAAFYQEMAVLYILFKLEIADRSIALQCRAA